MTEHTPTPWDFDEGDFTLYELETTDPIADWAFPPSREDAEFIVRAVNAHDALLAAAEAALLMADAMCAVHSPDPVWVELAAQLRAAISQARGEA